MPLQSDSQVCPTTNSKSLLSIFTLYYCIVSMSVVVAVFIWEIYVFLISTYIISGDHVWE